MNRSNRSENRSASKAGAQGTPTGRPYNSTPSADSPARFPSTGRKDLKHDQTPNNTSDYSASHSAEWDKDYRGQQWDEGDRSFEKQIRPYDDSYRPSGRTPEYKPIQRQFGSQDFDSSGAHYRDYADTDSQNSSRRESHVGKGPKGYQRSDERIHEEVSEALTQHSDIDAREVEVKVTDGIVTLSGQIESRQMKRMMEATIEHLPGVKDVRNEVHIQSLNGGILPAVVDSQTTGAKMPSNKSNTMVKNRKRN